MIQYIIEPTISKRDEVGAGIKVEITVLDLHAESKELAKTLDTYIRNLKFHAGVESHITRKEYTISKKEEI
jgi:hypothetical protein